MVLLVVLFGRKVWRPFCPMGFQEIRSQLFIGWHREKKHTLNIPDVIFFSHNLCISNVLCSDFEWFCNPSSAFSLTFGSGLWCYYYTTYTVYTAEKPPWPLQHLWYPTPSPTSPRQCRTGTVRLPCYLGRTPMLCSTGCWDWICAEW